MKINLVAVLQFGNRWWFIARPFISSRTAFFYPEGQTAISIYEMRGIVKEMEKMQSMEEQEAHDKKKKIQEIKNGGF